MVQITNNTHMNPIICDHVMPPQDVDGSRFQEMSRQTRAVSECNVHLSNVDVSIKAKEQMIVVPDDLGPYDKIAYPRHARGTIAEGDPGTPSGMRWNTVVFIACSLSNSQLVTNLAVPDQHRALASSFTAYPQKGKSVFQEIKE